jgi:Ni/Co efflux regulator RcnB
METLMKYFRSIGITLLALSMGLGNIASAQDRDRGPPKRNDASAQHRGPPDRNERSHGPSRPDMRDQRSGPRNQANNGAPRNNQGYDQEYNQRGEYRDRNGDWRGAGPDHNFRRGGYLSRQYRSPQYVVEDWRGHHLNAPPRGYHWVQTGGDYVLVAIATGLILQILLNY